MEYRVGAVSDIGYEREKMEDYMAFAELDDYNLFCIIADGTGSRENFFQPAPMVCIDIIENVKSYFSERADMFLEDPEFFLKRFMLDANKLIGAYRNANEELFSGYAASVTCCLFDENRMIHIAHSGNTRLYIIRDGIANQVTTDHTVAWQLLEDGQIDEETYHVHPQRLDMTSGLGLITTPEIETFSGSLQDNDVVLMTTDGIHYALRPEVLAELVLRAGEPTASCQALVDAARDVIQYPDNMAAMVIA